MSSIGLLRDPLFLLHSNGPEHPESSDRLLAIDAMLDRFPSRDRLIALPARDATREEISWIHQERYIRGIEQTRGGDLTALDPDTSANEHSYAAAVRAAGGVLSCVDAAMDGGLAGAFALVRPPGHHAEADQAMGFCLFNNVAIASQYALRRFGLQRVLVFDWDVHHGNGTMHSFYETDRVLYVSTHQYPHYPGTGRIDEVGSGPGAGYTVNVPLPPGQGDRDYLAIVERVIMPLASRYQPQLVLVSAGFDIARGDPLGDMEVSPAGFAGMTKMLMAMAAAFCPGRLVFALEGGYSLAALANGVSAVLSALVDGGGGEEQAGGGGEERAGGDERDSGPSRETQTVIQAVLKTLNPYWDLG